MEVFLVASKGHSEPGKILGGEREFWGRFVLNFKNRRKERGSFLRNCLLGVLDNTWSLMEPRVGRPALQPVASYLGRNQKGLNQKKVPSTQAKSSRRSSALVEDLLYQDRGGLIEGLCPKSSGSRGVSMWSTWDAKPEYLQPSQPEAASSLGVWSSRGFPGGPCKLLPNAPISIIKDIHTLLRCLNSSTIISFLLYAFSPLKLLLRFFSANRPLKLLPWTFLSWGINWLW